jgi:hypothetical protein
VSDLKPGDLCVTLDGLGPARCPAGVLVVLIEIDASECARGQQPYQPFWRASGLPKIIYSISHMRLRKIPPAPLNTADDTDESILESIVVGA